MAAVLPREGLDKLEVLANFVSPAIFQIWSSRWNITSSFCEAKKRDIYPSYSWHTVRAASFEHLTIRLQALSLETLNKDCYSQSVTAAQYREESTWDAVITGLQSHLIHQRLLERFEDHARSSQIWTVYNSFTIGERSVPSHPCPRGRAGPARSQHVSCNRRLKSLVASAVETISTPVWSVQLVM